MTVVSRGTTLFIIVWRPRGALATAGLTQRRTLQYTLEKQDSITILYSFVLLQYTVHMGGNIASNEHLTENDLEKRRNNDVEG
jgi:hypothetical protein